MGLSRRSSWLLILLFFFCVLQLLFLNAYGDGKAHFKFLETPLPITSKDSAIFGFEISEDVCNVCSITCKLDNIASYSCNSKKVSYKGLHDGDHTFKVCANGSLGVQHCSIYMWTIDTVPPTAHVSATSPFTSMSNATVHISFNKPCTGGGGFRCTSEYCSLLVYGAGHIIPSTLKVIKPDLEFSLMVAISTDVQYGRLVLVMDKNFCTDAGGNKFNRTSDSSFLLHFDRRNASVILRTHVPKKLLQLNGVTRTAVVTNNNKDLKFYLYFSDPVLNSSMQILNNVHASSGSISPTNGDSLGNRRFGYIVSNLSSMAIVTLTCDATSIISRQGTPSSSSDPVTFLYDAERPSVKLSTSYRKRTTENNIPVFIKFVKPVFGFNASSIAIFGAHLQSFSVISRSIYKMEIHANNNFVSIQVPENATVDIAGNKNTASDFLHLRHYSVPTVSSLVSTITTVIFAATSMAAIFLTLSTANILSFGIFSKPSTHLVSEPSRNLLRIACHIQVFALSKWLASEIPMNYYEFARGIEWSIPYISLPWETNGIGSFTKDSAPPFTTFSEIWDRSKLGLPFNYLHNSSLYELPLTPIEYRLFLEDQDMKPEARLVLGGARSFTGWKFFGRNMFWLGIIGGGLMVLHGLILFVIKLRRKKLGNRIEFGALVFPRFEIFLLFLALPCICQASAAIIRGNTASVAIGIILIGISFLILVSVFFFLSIGITFGKLLTYKEVHQEGQQPHWYQELVRVSLGPGKRGQWTWKARSNSTNLTRFGPLFEDLRGPPKYMLSQFSRRPVSGNSIIASDDENEDSEAPIIQKLFGILRIYYTLLECVKRSSLGILAGLYSTTHQTSKTPALIMLTITAFQLFFLVLKKPFIKKRVQFVEIISVASELFIFAATFNLVDKEASEKDEKQLGFAMLAMFSAAFLGQIINEWYSLYLQVIRLSPGDHSFTSGLKTATIGILLFVLPSRLVEELGKELGGDCGESMSLDAGDKPWAKQLRKLAKDSFNREEERGTSVKDPSTSKSGFWSAKDPSSSKSGFGGGKRSGSSSMASSDYKAKGEMKEKSLYKDFEAIFSSSSR